MNSTKPLIPRILPDSYKAYITYLSNLTFGKLAAIHNLQQGRLIRSIESTRATAPITIREICHLSNRIESVGQEKRDWDYNIAASWKSLYYIVLKCSNLKYIFLGLSFRFSIICRYWFGGKFVMGRVDYDTWTQWYGSIPSTIILADPCDIICLSIIVTDVECSRSSHGSTVAGNTIGDGCIACKSSVYTSLIHCPTSSSNAKVCKVCQSAL